jgi:hypothetical protein
MRSIYQKLLAGEAVPDNVKQLFDSTTQDNPRWPLLTSNRGAKCARDMVQGCRRCSRIVCRVRWHYPSVSVVYFYFFYLLFYHFSILFFYSFTFLFFSIFNSLTLPHRFPGLYSIQKRTFLSLANSKGCILCRIALPSHLVTQG